MYPRKWKMTNEQLNEILEEHKLWLSGRGGERADLRDADLRNADLRDADLRDADLRRADLSNANIECANLRGAILGNANLRGANLSNVYLDGANLINTQVYTFTLGKHFGFYYDGYVKIGCIGMNIDEWLEQNTIKKIGKENNYTKSQIKAYYLQIKLIKLLIDTKVLK